MKLQVYKNCNSTSDLFLPHSFKYYVYCLIIRRRLYTSPQETKITLVFFLVVHISILIWLLWKLKHQYQYDCTVRAWFSCIITNQSNQSTLFKAIIGQAHMTALKRSSLIKIFWLLLKQGWCITNQGTPSNVLYSGQIS